MSRDWISVITSELDETFEDELLCVGQYGHDSIELTPEDAPEGADPETLMRDLRLDSLVQAAEESLYDLGRLDCSIRLFEEAIVVNASVEQGRGIVVVLDPDASGDDVRTVARTCATVLRDDHSTYSE